MSKKSDDEIIEPTGGYMMSRIRYHSDRVCRRILKQGGYPGYTSAQQIKILSYLRDRGDMTISEISALTSQAKSTLTSVLDKMEGTGLIQRIPDKEDRRQIWITLTEDARKISENFVSVAEKVDDMLFEGFSDEEKRVFIDQLSIILQNIVKYDNGKYDE